MRLACATAAMLFACAAAWARSPDVEHGGQIAAEGTKGGAPPCSSCHGMDGVGTTQLFPRLASQAGFYLYKQLADFRSGQRENAVMGPIAQQLSDQEMQDVAGFYASIAGPFAPPGPADNAILQRGGALAAIGSGDGRVPACANCHGRAGLGMPPSFPYLAGQSEDYLKGQLQAFRNASRRNDPLDVMRSVAASLTPDEIAAAAAYFARAYPPGLKQTGAVR